MDHWRLRFGILLILLLAVTPVFAQVQTGNIFGTVRTTDGSVLPGVSVTLTGIGAPLTFVADAQGNFRFLNLSPGTYAIRAELAGFGTTTRSGIGVSIGRNADVTVDLNPSVTDAITITAEAPLLDTRKTGTGATVTKLELETVPSGRDPWVVLQQAPGVQMDRMNIGGSESGQQSNYVSKGTNSSQATWNIDGVNITDVGALGSSPTYYDFDAFEEMQVTTGGTDVRIQTPGVQLNMVTKRGTNDFTGSGRYLHTSGDLQADPKIPEEATLYLARANEISNIDDYGLELGGPVIRDRLWAWGAFSRQDIKLFTAQRVIQLAEFPDPFHDDTELETLNGKLNAQLLANNSFASAYTKGNKVKFGRNVGPDRPPETGWNQDGPTDVWKLEDTHIFGSNFYVTGLYSHVNSVFNLIADQGQRCVTLECAQSAAMSWVDAGAVPHRSFLSYMTERPQDQYRGDGSSYFSTGAINHELKFGFGFRDAQISSFSAYPQSSYAYMFGNTELTPGAVGLAVLTRDTNFDYTVQQTDAYVGDTILSGNLTIQAGLRFDKQVGNVQDGATTANPLVPEILPAISFNGASLGEIEWTSISPRIGLTYALGADRKTLLRAAANRYVDQLGAAAVYSVSPTAYQYVYYYFEDVNGDGTVQRPEIDFATGMLGFFGLDPNDTTHAVQTTRYDNDMKVPTTDELIVGFERELLTDFVFGVNGTYRRLNDFVGYRYEWHKGQGDFVQPSDYEVSDPVTGTFPDGTTYTSPVYALPTRPIYRVITNLPGYSQTYKGLELTGTKRMSNRWMMRGNFSWNDWTQQIGEEGLVDPTQVRTAVGCNNCDGGTVVSGSGAGSGAKGGVYVNSEWQYNLTGAYQLPVIETSFGFNLTGRQGYPVPFVHRVYVASEAIYKQVLPGDDIDTYRLPDVHNLDLRLAKDIRMAGVGLTLSAELFNVLNANTELQRYTRLNNVRKNEITETQSPRVFRVGARLTF